MLFEEILTMKKQVSVLVCLALAATAVMAQTPQPQTAAPVVQTRQAELSTWKKYTVEGERFSVLLPTVPAMTTYKTLIWELRKSRRQRSIGVYADGTVYSIFVSENVGQSLNDFISERIRYKRWENASETSVMIGDFRGRQYSNEDKALRDTAQFFSADGRYYEFSATGYFDEDAVKQFFSSIVFAKNADGVKVEDGAGLPFNNPTCDELLTGRQVDSKVRLVQKPEPTYTELAREKQVTGTVTIKAVFSCNGTVTDIRTVEGLPHGLTEQAIAAAKKIKYVPAVKGGKYASMWMQLVYNFNLY
jgi:TonB family protein